MRETTIKARIMRLGIITVTVALVCVIFLSSTLTFVNELSSYQEESSSLASAYSAILNNTFTNVKSNLVGIAGDAATKDIESYFDNFSWETAFDTLKLEAGNNSSGVSVTLSENNLVLRTGIPNSDYTLVGTVPADYLLTGFDALKSSEYEAILLDSNGNLITSSSKDADYAILKGVAASDSDTVHQNGYFASYNKIADSDWVLFIKTDFSNVMSTVWQNYLCSLIALILLEVVAIFVCKYVAKRISDPVIGITERIKLLAEGDFTSKCDVVGRKDETGVLVESTKVMLSSLNSYVSDISSRLEKLSSGETTTKAGVTYAGDFVALCHSIDTFQDKLHSSLELISKSADSLNGNAEQIASASQALSDNAMSQASAANELQSSIEGITAKSVDTAKTAEQVASLAEEVTGQTMSGKEQIDQLIAAIQNIKDKSDAISGIVKTIDDIAFQTNILSLNASIEAARAGDAGKGFGVVATEVGSLASKSAEATKETATLISETLKAVAEGIKLAEEAEISISSIVSGIEGVSKKMESIAVAVNEQQIAVEQAQKGIAQISDGLQGTTASAEECAASSAELFGLSQSLNDTVSYYKL